MENFVGVPTTAVGFFNHLNVNPSNGLPREAKFFETSQTSWNDYESGLSLRKKTGFRNFASRWWPQQGFSEEEDEFVMTKNKLVLALARLERASNTETSDKQWNDLVRDATCSFAIVENH